MAAIPATMRVSPRWARGIPFVRFCATGFWPREMQLYLTNRAEYFRRLDEVLRTRPKNTASASSRRCFGFTRRRRILLVNRWEWANPRSKTQAFMRDYVREVVTRYRDNPAVWLWEFGNEYALEASLPNAVEHVAGGPATGHAY